MAQHNRREKMANRLLKRGHASIKEILASSYGVWPPKGLKIDAAVTHDDEVKLVVVNKEDAKVGDMEYAGMVYMYGKNIFLNEGLEDFGRMRSRRARLNTVVGHEATHLLQGATGHAARVDNAVSTLKAFDKAFPEKGQLRKSFNAKAKRSAVKYAKYYAQGIEVQARLHQMMAEGYQQWGRLPQNREELWMAFSCFDFTPPPKVTALLNWQTAVDPSLKDLKKPVAVDHSADHGIQYFYDVLSAPAKQKFWEETLPELYVSLVEMYGDKTARARFGLAGEKTQKVKITVSAERPLAAKKDEPPPAGVAWARLVQTPRL